MLSRGEWYKQVPKGKRENLRYRSWLLKQCRGHARHQKAMKVACRDDLLFYVNAFCWTYDPRLVGGKSIPFLSWEFQDRAFRSILEGIEEGRDLVIEKSRDMGASWMSLTVMEWLWHFHPGNSFLMVSRKEDLVDAPGDPDSLFWKVDFIHRHLPDWLRPATDRRKLHFGNLDNGSTIDGESTTAAAGVGGRRTAMFIDEFSRIEEGYQLLAGTADTTRCRIFNFTPFGTSNAAYKLARRGDVRKLRLHWSEHPEKARGLYRYDEKAKKVLVLDTSYVFAADFQFIMDGRLRSPWYDGECKRRANEREVAQMLDIDYQGSAYQFFDRGLIRELQSTYAIPPLWEGDMAFDGDTGRPVDLVPGRGGPLQIWLNLNQQNKPPVGPYAMGADLCAGTGATNSCLSILEGRTGEKVAEFASPFLKPDQLAPVATALCWLFKDEYGEGARFAWEMQGPGITFGRKVIELGYRNVYMRASEQTISKKASLENPGWFPSLENKDDLLREYRTALATRQFLNRSHLALEECLFFIHDKDGHIKHSEEIGYDDPTGARVNHGDRVIADALAWKMVRSLGLVRAKEKVEEVKVGSLAWRRQLHDRERQTAGAW